MGCGSSLAGSASNNKLASVTPAEKRVLGKPLPKELQDETYQTKPDKRCVSPRTGPPLA